MSLPAVIDEDPHHLLHLFVLLPPPPPEEGRLNVNKPGNKEQISSKKLNPEPGRNV